MNNYKNVRINIESYEFYNDLVNLKFKIYKLSKIKHIYYKINIYIIKKAIETFNNSSYIECTKKNRIIFSPLIKHNLIINQSINGTNSLIIFPEDYSKLKEIYRNYKIEKIIKH